MSRQECILNRIFSVGRIVQLSISRSVKGRSTARENVLHLSRVFPSNADFEVLFAFDVCFCPLHWFGASAPESNMHAAFQISCGECFRRVGQWLLEMAYKSQMAHPTN